MKMRGLIQYVVGAVCMLFIAETAAQSVTSVREYNAADPVGSFRFNAKSDGVKGTPFLYEEPLSAKVALRNGKVYEDIPFNILPEREEVYIQTDGMDSEPLVLRNWEWLETVEEFPRLFRMEYIEGKQRIVEVLFEKERDKYVVLHTKQLVKPTNLKDGYTGAQYDIYRSKVAFYKVNGLQSDEFKGNTAGLKQLSDDRYVELRGFIKENGLKPERPHDMKLVLEYLFSDS